MEESVPSFEQMMEQSGMQPEQAMLVGGIAFGAILIILLVVLIIKIFYLLSMQKAIGRCAPANQAMSPGLVWLGLIPVVNLVWDFFIVINVAKSLGAEFQGRGMHEPEAPGKTIGLVMCICNCCAWVPAIGGLIGLGGLVCWIIYWVQIAGFSAKLLEAVPVTVPVE